MKIKKFRIILVLSLLSFSLTLFAQESASKGFNCFSIIVGKKASADGSVLLAHNEDDYGTQIVNLYKVPRKKHQPGDRLNFINGGSTEQIAETNGFIWFEIPTQQFGDSYINEYGVVIASDACNSREKYPELEEGGIAYWLRRLMAERARTAKQAVKIAGRLVEEFGYASSGRTYVIADANQAWMLSVVEGKHWVAQRVPDDHVAVIPNFYTIGEVNLADTSNFLGAVDILSYSIKSGWFDPEAGEKFNFREIYSPPGAMNNPGNVHRMWRGINLIAGANFKITDKFPFSIKPDKKISVQNLMRVLRDHYIGTELDKTENYKLGNPYELNRSTICANSNQYGFVAQLRNWMPVEIGTLIWLSPRRPDSQAFIPIYLGAEEMPKGYYYEDCDFAILNHFDPPAYYYNQKDDHAFWAFWRLADWVDQDYGKRIIKVREKWNAIETHAFAGQNEFEKKLLQLFTENPDATKKLITKHSNDAAAKSWKTAKELIIKND